MKTGNQLKFIHYKIFIDPDTGEEIPVQINLVKNSNFNFHKTWLKHLIHSFGNVVNQKLKLAFWIIENLDKEYQLIMTQRKIAKASGISYQTVNTTIRLLSEGHPAFLQKINSGAYRINPDLLFNRNHSNRIGVCYEYIQQEAKNQEKNSSKN